MFKFKKISWNINYSLFIIGIIGLVLMYVSYDYANQIEMYKCFTCFPYTWYKDVFLNCGSGLISSIIVIILYNCLMSYKKDKNKEHISKMAKNQIKDIIFIYLSTALWSLTGEPPIPVGTNNIKEYFDKKYYEKIRQCNLNGKNYIVGKYTNFDYISTMYDKSKNRIDNIIEAYIMYLDYELIKEIRKFYSPTCYFLLIIENKYLNTDEIYLMDNQVLRAFKEHIDISIDIINKLKD